MEILVVIALFRLLDGSVGHEKSRAPDNFLMLTNFLMKLRKRPRIARYLLWIALVRNTVSSETSTGSSTASSLGSEHSVPFLASNTSTTGSVMTLRIQIETSRFYIDIGSRSSGSTNSTRSIMVRTNIISSWIRQQISKSIISFGAMASSLLRLHSDWVCGL